MTIIETDTFLIPLKNVSFAYLNNNEIQIETKTGKSIIIKHDSKELALTRFKQLSEALKAEK